MRNLVRSILVLAASLAAAPALAQAIGDASFVRKDVRGIIGGRLVPVNLGDTVYRDQIIRTAADSSTVLVFLDKSSVAIGPQSEVRLDEFVFRGATGPRTVDAVKGIFRFISGAGSGAHDYSVRTPHATISVRGTTFDVRVTDAGTTVVLHDGAVEVCSGGECRSLTPGETVDARPKGKGISEVRPLAPADWTYGLGAREQRAALDAARGALEKLAAANGVKTALHTPGQPAGERTKAAAAKSADAPAQASAAPVATAETKAVLPSPDPATASPEKAGDSRLADVASASEAPAVEVAPAPLALMVAGPGKNSSTVPAAAPSASAEQPPPTPTTRAPDAQRSVVVAEAPPAPHSAKDASSPAREASNDALSVTLAVMAVTVDPSSLPPRMPYASEELRQGPLPTSGRNPAPSPPSKVNLAVLANNKDDGRDVTF